MALKLHAVRKLWPLACGLAVGGLIGGITHAWSVGALFGGIAGVYFYWDLFRWPRVPARAIRAGADLSSYEIESLAAAGVGTGFPDVCDLEQQSELYAQGVAGAGPYAHLHRDQN